MKLTEFINAKETAFLDICQTHEVKWLYAFGSAVTGHFDEKKSDIDLLVEVNLSNPVEKGETLLSLWDILESFFQRKVDLLTESSIKNPYLKKSIDSTKVLVYDGSRKKVLI